MSYETTELPNAEGPEKSLLSSMIQSPEIYIQRAKAGGLIPSMFYSPARKIIFQILIKKQEAGKAIELVEMSQYLIDTDQLEAIGGPGTLSEIYTYAPSPAHFESHLEIVRDRFAKREALRMADKVKEAALGGETSEDALRALTEGTEAVRLASTRAKAFLDSKAALEKFTAAMQERFEAGDMPGQSTGIHQLDGIGGGIRNGDYWVICGETSAGKSCLSYQIACPAISAGKHVLIFTLEMEADEVFSRLIACSNSIPLRPIMNPREIKKGEMEKIQRAARALGESNLHICDEANMSIDFVCSQSEQFSETDDISMIVVDYIQLLASTAQRGQSREQELSAMSKRLRQLAKKLNCAVITPAQLNDDGRIRESRSLGQDATAILKITDAGIAIDKYRNSSRDDLLPLKLNGAIQRFETDFQPNRNH